MSHKFYYYKGDLIGLRPLVPEDINNNYLGWFADSEVCKYNSHGIFPKTRIDLETYIRSSIGSKEKIVWAIDDSQTNQHIGNLSLNSIDFINRNAEFAILIGAKEVWGKGYAKQAARFLIHHAFYKLNLHKIYCGTASTNLSMQRLAQALEMQEEGALKEALYLEGKYVDILLYGLIRDYASQL